MSAPSEEFDLSKLTADQLEVGVHKALQLHDVQAVHGLLLLMALKDPYRADRIRTELLTALAIARGDEVRIRIEPASGSVPLLPGGGPR